MEAPSRWKEINHQSSVTFAIEGIRALLLANGGAVLAILTFCGNATSDQVDLRVIASSLGLFAWGLAAALACALFGYVSQALFTDAKEGPAKVLRVLAVLSASSSLVLFVGACLIAQRGFHTALG